jgi:hypothetical protein
VSRIAQKLASALIGSGVVENSGNRLKVDISVALSQLASKKYVDGAISAVDTTSTSVRKGVKKSELSNYLYKPGKVNGQVANGGKNRGDTLVLNGSAHADKGPIGLNTTPVSGWGAKLRPIQIGEYGAIWTEPGL